MSGAPRSPPNTCRTRRSGSEPKADQTWQTESGRLRGLSCSPVAALCCASTPTRASHARGRWFETSRAHAVSQPVAPSPNETASCRARECRTLTEHRDYRRWPWSRMRCPPTPRSARRQELGAPVLHPAPALSARGEQRHRVVSRQWNADGDGVPEATHPPTVVRLHCLPARRRTAPSSPDPRAGGCGSGTCTAGQGRRSR
jgi:hypothetical protein